MAIDIDHLTEAELIDLNRRVVERLKFLQHMRAHSEMLQYSIGEHVAFRANGTTEVSGIVAKYNRKTVSVIAENGQQWNVSPSLLYKPDSTTTVESFPAIESEKNE